MKIAKVLAALVFGPAFLIILAAYVIGGIGMVLKDIAGWLEKNTYLFIDWLDKKL